MILPRFVLPLFLSLVSLQSIVRAGNADIVIQFTAKNIRDGSALQLDSIRIRNLALGRDTTLVGVTSYVIRMATEAGEVPVAPERFALSNNFVNPFAAETEARLFLAEQSDLQLTLYDILGNAIASRSERALAGAHQFRIEGSSLYPGIYFLCARTGRELRTIKLMKMGPAGSRAASIGPLARVANGVGSLGKHAGVPVDDYRFIGFSGGYRSDTLFARPPASGEYSFSIHADRLPLLLTAPVGGIGLSGAEGGGRVISDGGFPVTSRGICWNPLRIPTVDDSRTEAGSGIGAFSAPITALSPRTMYWVRAYAVNSQGIGYGPATAFVTAQDGSENVMDVDGNVYHTIRLGAQTWMVENLNVTRSRFGDPIPNVADASTWRGWKKPAWCHFDNDPANSVLYGRLYNFYAACDSPSITPPGWHIPGDDDWQILVNYLGGDGVAGGRMKEAGTTHWSGPNSGATNESGFTGLGTGRRDVNGLFSDRGTATRFWSNLVDHSNSAWIRGLNSGNTVVYFDNYEKRSGLTIRCIKD